MGQWFRAEFYRRRSTAGRVRTVSIRAPKSSSTAIPATSSPERVVAGATNQPNGIGPSGAMPNVFVSLVFPLFFHLFLSLLYSLIIQL